MTKEWIYIMGNHGEGATKRGRGHGGPRPIRTARKRRGGGGVERTGQDSLAWVLWH